MKNLMLALAVGLAASTASAQLIFDNSAGMNGRTFRGAGDAPLTFIFQVASPTTIDRFEVLNTADFDGNIRFMIYTDGATTPTYLSGTSAVLASGDTWRSSPSGLNFTLNPGSTYYFGAMMDVGGSYPYSFPASPFTQSGISTGNGVNGNHINFASPTRGGDGLTDIALRLYAVPAPGAMAMLGLAGLVAGRRRR